MNIKEIIKAVVPAGLKKRIIEKRQFTRCEEKYREICDKRKEKPLIFLLATPNHGNVGDQAIAIAELSFLDHEFIDHHIVEISFQEYAFMKELLVKWVQPQDVLCYHGGGNMGIQYFECEYVFRDIIQRFPENRIVSFPQTMFYGESEKGIRELKNSQRIYNAHFNLTLTARETFSYDVMKEAYPACKVILTPDIVLYYNGIKESQRYGAMTCLRSDVEKNLSVEAQQYIFHKLEQDFHKVNKSDTVVMQDYVSKQERFGILERKLQEFRCAEVVVTDRLHGMVFAYLTHTPCIVFSNYNYKVSGVYEWIRNNDFIAFVQSIDEFDAALSSVLHAKGYETFDCEKFLPLKEAILGRQDEI